MRATAFGVLHHERKLVGTGMSLVASTKRAATYYTTSSPPSDMAAAHLHLVWKAIAT